MVDIFTYSGDYRLCHAQQIIWQLFNAVKKGFAASGNTNKAFLAGLLPHLTFTLP
jgi:hypothetical protein